MCLVTKESYHRTAKDDITVYKILREDNKAKFVQDYTYKKGENRPTEGSVQIPKPDKFGYIYLKWGWLHAFTEKARAERSLAMTAKVDDYLQRKGDQRRKFKIVEMVVPKGEEYYLGEDDDFLCAKKLYWEGE